MGEPLPPQIRVEGLRWKPFFGQRLFVSKLTLRPELLRSLPSFGAGLAADEAAFSFRDAAFRLDSAPSGRRLRILSLRSPSVELRGALCFEEGVILKGNIAAFFPAAWTERLPENLARRLSSASGGRKILKCAYNGHQLTLYGRSGPLVRAAWSPD